ncbi:MAG TPA: PKD domain-containing protein [Solirubrobacteraceae bacterium]|nr:PKD domain-containing protein [Solirubrobacteraceae bacterium]
MVVLFGVSASAAHAQLSVPSQTFTSLAQFEAAAGGADNGTTVGEQGSGFRHWTPAGIAVDGSDPGSTAIPGGHSAALSPSRLQPWGIELGPEVAVANDGFQSVNPNAGFSPPDLWAPFNSNMTTFQVVAPAPQAGAAVPAVTRGLGVMFVNVENTATTIQYYSGNMLLGQVTASEGTTSFAGELFADPVVTSVVITLGTAEIFGFDGSTLTPGTAPADALTAGDDIVLAEPGAGQATAAATAGVPVTLTLDSFDSSDAPGDITATVNWGDGTGGGGTVVPAGGGAFTVTGSHGYAQPGTYTATVTVEDFSGSELTTQALIQVAPRASATSVTCSPSTVAVSATTVCTAIVSDPDGGTPSSPTGLVTFSSPTSGAAFPGAGSCILGPTAAQGTSLCEVQFEPGQRPPVQARITAAYGGDGVHGASSATTTVAVDKQRCSLSALSRRLRAGGFALIVTCDARSDVQIAAHAHATREGVFRAFQVVFGSIRSLVTAGRPTVLVIRPARGVLPALRVALQRHQHVSLKLTLTASSHAVRTTTTKRISAIRAS